MAFEPLRLKSIGGQNNKDFGGDIFSYSPSSDSWATVFAASYWDTAYQSLEAGDAIMVNHSTGVNMLKVTAKDIDSVTTVHGDDGMVNIQIIAAAGAVDLLSRITQIESVGAAQAMTLADGYLGQRKTVIHAIDGGSAVLTPVTGNGYTTITFTTAGETVELVFGTLGWMVAGLGGLSASLPVIA